MAISQQHTFVDTDVLTAAQLNAEFSNLITGINNLMQTGLAASRPAGAAGQLYFATDTKITSQYDGAAWQTVPFLGTVQTWTAAQTFAASGIKLTGTASNLTTFASAATAARTITFPDATGMVITSADSGTVTNGMLAGSIDLPTKVSGVLPAANGGTGIAYATLAGPTVARTYTLPDASATVLTTNAAVTVAQGGTGLATMGAKGAILAATAAGTLNARAVGTDGQVLTADSAQADGMKWATPSSGMINPMTGLGDSIYGGASGTPTRLAGNATTTRKFWRQVGDGTNSAAPAWDTLAVGDLPTIPACRAYNSANISVATGTVTALTFDSERFDYDNIHSTSSNTSRLTCNTAGVYCIQGGISFAANNTGVRQAVIRLNGTTNIASQKFQSVADGATNTDCVVSVLYYLAANDYVELTAYQASGGALNVLTGNGSPEFGMVRVG